MLKYVQANFSNPRSLNSYENGQWIAYSTEDVLREVKHLALGLVSIGLKKGDCVGLMALPSPRWTIADFAVITRL